MLVLLAVGCGSYDELPMPPLGTPPELAPGPFPTPTDDPRVSPSLVAAEADQDGMFALLTLQADADGPASVRFGPIGAATVEFVGGVAQVLAPIPSPCAAIPGPLDWAISIGDGSPRTVHVDLVGAVFGDVTEVPGIGEGPLVVCGTFADPDDAADATITIPDDGPAGMSGGVYRFRATENVAFLEVESAAGGYTVPGQLAPVGAGEKQVIAYADQPGAFAYSVEAQ